MKVIAAISMLALVSLAAGAAPSLPSKVPRSIPEEIEWTWGVRPLALEPGLPNVLLLGDSITRAYYPAVKRRLAGTANVYLFATSASVGDPRLAAQVREFSRVQAVRFRVIHFNNGMHGWDYSEAQFEAGFPAFVRAVSLMTPGAALIWTSITPVKSESMPGPSNARVDRRNAIAKRLAESRRIPIDDQHALMLGHPDNFEDAVHFNAAGAELQGAQAAAAIEAAL